MSRDLTNVTLQSTRHEVVFRGLREMTKERQVMSHNPSVTTMVLVVQNSRKCITYILYSKRIVIYYRQKNFNILQLFFSGSIKNDNHIYLENGENVLHYFDTKSLNSFV